jgi:hypothetical protein
MAEALAQVQELLPGTEGGGCCGLTYPERIIGFGISTVCAFLAGSLAIFSLFLLNLRKASVLFTVSTLLFMFALGMLVGWRRLLNAFTDRKRLIASLCMLGGILVVLFFGLVKKWIILAIVGFVVELLAFFYFALSYIPGGDRLFHLLLF